MEGDAEPGRLVGAPRRQRQEAVGEVGEVGTDSGDRALAAVGWAGGVGVMLPPPTSDQCRSPTACQVIGARSPDDAYG